MDTCPFCQSPVQGDLIRFGGSCPTCFNEIPGEEAATDPGVQAAAAVAAEEAAAAESKSSGLLFAAVGLAALLGGVGFWAWSNQQEAAQIAATQEDVGELFIVPADELDDEMAEADRLANEEAEAAAAEQARLAAASQRASGNGTASAAPLDTPSRLSTNPTGTTANGEIAPPQTSMVPTPTSGVGDDLAIAPTLVGATVVLSDPSEIRTMIKGVMDKYLPRFKRCYDQQLKLDSSLRGKWWLAFKVGTSGKPLGVRVSGEGVSHPDLEACVSAAANEMTFQRISAAQDIRYPLNFSR